MHYSANSRQKERLCLASFLTTTNSSVTSQQCGQHTSSIVTLPLSLVNANHSVRPSWPISQQGQVDRQADRQINQLLSQFVINQICICICLRLCEWVACRQQTNRQIGRQTNGTIFGQFQRTCVALATVLLVTLCLTFPLTRFSLIKTTHQHIQFLQKGDRLLFSCAIGHCSVLLLLLEHNSKNMNQDSQKFLN